MENKYLEIIKKKFNINNKDNFIKQLIIKICNQLTDKNDKDYLINLSNNFNILLTLKKLGYYIIKNSSDENKKENWNTIIDYIDEFFKEIRELKQFKEKLIIEKSLNNNFFIDELIKKYIEPHYDNSELGKLQNIIDNNKEKLQEFKNNDTFIKLNKNLLNELNNLNTKILCSSLNDDILFTTEITDNYSDYYLIVNVDNLNFFINNLKPKYSSYILSQFFYNNNEYLTNYIYYYINLYTFLNKSNQLKNNQYVSWQKMNKSIINTLDNIFDTYLGKIQDYSNLKDKDIKYENINYYLKKIMDIDNINLNTSITDVNKKIIQVLSSCFDLKLSFKIDNNEFYKINSNRIINGETNKQSLIIVNYNDSMNFEFIPLNEINVVLISIPMFLINNNNNYNKSILIYFDELIKVFSDAIFNLLNPPKYYIQSEDYKLYHIIFNKFCFMIIYDKIGFIFNKKNKEEFNIKKYLSIIKALQYNECLINLIFQCELLSEKFNKKIIDSIKKVSSKIQIDKLLNDTINGIYIKKYTNIYNALFIYADKLNIFNPLLTFDKNYILDIKLEIYTCSIYKQFKENIRIKKQNKKECSTIYNILDIDDFNNFITNQTEDKISIDSILDVYFSFDKNYVKPKIDDDIELMTETYYEINKVITKEIF